jgi:hypothetical protein
MYVSIQWIGLKIHDTKPLCWRVKKAIACIYRRIWQITEEVTISSTGWMVENEKFISLLSLPSI